MNDRKLNQLLKSTRHEPAPAVPAGFDQQVMRTIRREVPTEPATLLDQLNALFPRLVFAALVLIAACVAGDFYLTPANGLSLTEGVAQFSDQWFFTANGF